MKYLLILSGLINPLMECKNLRYDSMIDIMKNNEYRLILEREYDGSAFQVWTSYKTETTLEVVVFPENYEVCYINRIKLLSWQKDNI